MAPADSQLDALAGAILDGTTVDWDAVESNADADTRWLLDQLRAVAGVAEVHRLATTRSMPGPSRDGLAAPREWGHLTLLERIGSGAFGEVYRAWDNRLDREVAFKLLPPGSASGNPRVSSVIEEGRLLARVRHPNVVTIYGAERIGDRAGLW